MEGAQQEWQRAAALGGESYVIDQQASKRVSWQLFGAEVFGKLIIDLTFERFRKLTLKRLDIQMSDISGQCNAIICKNMTDSN